MPGSRREYARRLASQFRRAFRIMWHEARGDWSPEQLDAELRELGS